MADGYWNNSPFAFVRHANIASPSGLFTGHLLKKRPPE
jgi:hypothetical protein